MANIEIKLSCLRCGSTEFKDGEIPSYKTGENDYCDWDDKDVEVICSRCGLSECIENLAPMIVREPMKIIEDIERANESLDWGLF